jgi:hypothetical protein
MDSFYTIVVVVAVSLLIVILIGIGIMLQANSKSKAFPLYSTQCPDGWIADGSNCLIPAPTHSNYPKKTGIDVANISTNLRDSAVYSGPSKLYNTETGMKFTFNPVATTCQKRLWANEYGVSWDGVSNYNKC